VAEGIAIAREMLDLVRAEVQGVQVSAPFGRVELALEVFGGAVARAAELTSSGTTVTSPLDAATAVQVAS
jgi:hypothetical protein